MVTTVRFIWALSGYIFENFYQNRFIPITGYPWFLELLKTEKSLWTLAKYTYIPNLTSIDCKFKLYKHTSFQKQLFWAQESSKWTYQRKTLREPMLPLQSDNFLYISSYMWESIIQPRLSRNLMHKLHHLTEERHLKKCHENQTPNNRRLGVTYIYLQTYF